MGDCIQQIMKNFGTIRIVKEKLRKPSTQGSGECSIKPFKDALYEWFEENPEGSWNAMCAFVIVMNQKKAQQVGYEQAVTLVKLSQKEQAPMQRAQRRRQKRGRREKHKNEATDCTRMMAISLIWGRG